MATNTTTKKPAVAAAAEESTTDVTDTPAARPKRAPAQAPPVVGPPLAVGADPVSVRLSHHLTIDGVDYRPGSEISVSPDYARRLRGQGYIART
ncbi:DUF7210 family protein [Streptomyces griseomycini]|uniref:Uncharacterized protein n=1 Tax=Streptomyces griseomycini TaxID=66895 RepID=A0A7W7PWA4_9ACTN|nr:hypothetical protein [Streptomyces griseomycini]MBB4902510.1 hypothetical protein [Streptomyces griseomycini]